MRLLPALFLTISILAIPTFSQATRPNVIIVMTDDQGYPELSAHGNPILKTPFLDKLYAQSLRLIDYHASPMCTPTRGSLMTGLDPARHGAINVSSGRTLLRKNLPTMADLLRQQGYSTGIFGKWHLGDNYPYRPQDRGFEETLWFPSSHIGSVPDHWGNNYFDDTYRWNGKLKKFTGYCTDIFFDHAIDWIKQRTSAEEPFFAYLPTNTPHGPFYAPDEDIKVMKDRVAKLTLPNMAPHAKSNLIRYLAMIRNFDTNMGRLMTFLNEAGLEENTILLFMTDNGSTFGHAYYPAGMRGRKTQLWEGGHRVPCFIRWPGGSLGNPRDIGGLTQTQDLLPTLLDLCGIKTTREFDGISLGPALRNRAAVPEERMLVINYSRMPGTLDFPTPDSPSILRRESGAVLWKRWRMLRDSELYNLETDPLQKKNVIDAHPKVTAKMRAHLDNWWDSVGETANEPQRVIIGHDAANPMMLTACEWLDVFIDQQRQIRRGDQKNGYWELDVAKAGRYEFELRRWPREANIPLSAAYNGQGALPITQARLFINRESVNKPVKLHDKAAKFTVTLPSGPVRLHTWFAEGRSNPICGAYYVYVKRI